MSNQLGMSKIQAILGLRQLGWSFVRIAAEVGLHRETVARYVREQQQQAAGFEPPKPTQVHTGSADSKPTQVHTGSAAADVTRSVCEPHRHTVLAMLEQGLSAVRIHQDLSGDHGFRGSYYSVMRFVRRLEVAHELPFRRLEVAPAEEAQVDFGTGIPIIAEGRKRKTHVLRIVLSYSRKAYSEAVFRQTTENFIRC
jgi:transposase